MKPRIAYSCVFENAPKFAVQLRIWLTTLTELAGVPRSDIVVHIVDGTEADATAAFLASQGVRSRPIARFGDGKYCNKLGALDDTAFAAFDYVALCDLDLAFHAGIERYAGTADIVAKPVDYPNPPVDVLDRLYAAAGFATRPSIVSCTNSAAPTFANNCNGGLYIVRSGVLPALAETWRKWALWGLERGDIVGAHMGHVDQIAFGLATWELGLDVERLPIEANMPTHAPREDYAATIGSPVVLHYHDNLAGDLTLNAVGIETIDESIRTVNETLRRARRAAFDNKTFWNYRYAKDPKRGSGLGSRGQNAVDKRRIIASAAPLEESVLDVGCGDLHIVSTLNFASYVGVDISDEAVARAREANPNWIFLAGDFLRLPLDPADTVLCLDVLIHESDGARYRAGVARLAALARKRLLIAGYNQAPWYTSDITYFHESLSTTLLACGFDSVDIVGGYRDTTMLVGRRAASP